jgi:hypothetical protein
MTGSAKQSILPRKERMDCFAEFVGWVEPRETHHLHKMQLMGIASLNPSYALRAHAVIASGAKQSILPQRKNGLLRGVYHRARIRATRWLAITVGCDF